MAKYSLPTMIAEARRELDMRRDVYPRQRMKDGELKIAIQQSIIDTLEWLYANEEKIKAKIGSAEQQGVVVAMQEERFQPSGRIYRQRQTAFLDYARGGWSHVFDILDDTDKVIGTKTTTAETRKTPPVTTFKLGAQIFYSAAEFIAAYEAQPASEAA